MPTWLVPTLKWGGVGLAIIAVIAIIYTQLMGVTPVPETGPTPTCQACRLEVLDEVLHDTLGELLPGFVRRVLCQDPAQQGCSTYSR